MNIQVDQNWWKDLFDEIYLLTDARSVCNEELTRQEVDFLENFILSDKCASILDLCGGQGRHSLELSRRGFINVTVLDYSRYLINLGKKNAKQEGLNTTFIHGDAREFITQMGNESFDLIITLYKYVPFASSSPSSSLPSQSILTNLSTILFSSISLTNLPAIV